MRRWVPLGGDLLLFLVFAALGRASHGLLGDGNPVWGVLRAAAPFAVAWLALAPFFHGHRLEPEARARTVVLRTGGAWLAAGLLGLILRSLALGRPAPLPFALITLFGNGALLIAWRLALTLWLRRRAPAGARL